MVVRGGGSNGSRGEEVLMLVRGGGSNGSKGRRP